VENLLLKFTGNVSLNMIYCKPAAFQMGASPDDSLAYEIEKPHHTVVFTNGFWISETPITRHMYSAIMGGEKRAYEESDDSPASQHTWEESLQFINLLNTQKKTIAHSLIDNISIDRLEINLPTEAQWEYACRAGTTTRWFFGDKEEYLPKYAWFGKRSSAKLPSVRQKKANPWGIYDMLGMVYEWCLDDFKSYVGRENQENVDIISYTVPKSPHDLVTKVCRGGCMTDRAKLCRSSSRTSILTWNSENDVTGIRLVINLN
jgi:formylglycine-generating enzyme required for sulfatase activity